MKKHKEHIINSAGNVVLTQINLAQSKDLLVRVLDAKGRQISNKCWHFPNTKLGMKLAIEKYEHALKGDYKPFKSLYFKEIEELAEKYYNQ